MVQAPLCIGIGMNQEFCSGQGPKVNETEIEVRQFGVHSIAVVQVHGPVKLSRQLVPSLGIAIVRL